ncbi:MAG: branched-chain amino acid transaminase [Candidatus Bathyarchaeota archaeon]|nr:branched-chain amino acid transaminase [Candidatus Bathyarchaeota archaeon]
MAALRKTNWIWVDGEFKPWDEARVHILTHALHYGTGVFEGIRAYASNGKMYVFRLKEHIERLFKSAKIYFMDIPYTVDEICRVIIELIMINDVREDCYIRPIVFRGYGYIGLNPLNNPIQVAIAVFPFGKYLSSGGVRCCVSSWRRIPGYSLPPQAKACGNYINSVLAKIEALKSGYDEAILLDNNGYVSEGSGENLFIVKDRELYTPPIYSDILEGVTRASVMEIASDLGYTVHERPIARVELYTCDEAFLTGTAAEITPILEIDGRRVGGGGEGPVTEHIRRIFEETVRGKFSKYTKWLTEVSIRKLSDL